jgi:hypothetical protein
MNIGELQAILRSMVNDLEKTAAVLPTLTTDARAAHPYSPADRPERLRLALEANAEFYEHLRKQIESLSETQ